MRFSTGSCRRWDMMGGLVSNNILFLAVRSEQVEFRFNLSTVASTEKILTAELHLFKLRPQASVSFNRHHFCQVCDMKESVKNNQWCLSLRDVSNVWLLSLCFLQVSVYQLLDNSKSNHTQRRKLLSSRLIPVHSTGWEVFTITQAVSSLLLCKHWTRVRIFLDLNWPTCSSSWRFAPGWWMKAATWASTWWFRPWEGARWTWNWSASLQDAATTRASSPCWFCSLMTDVAPLLSRMQVSFFGQFYIQCW